jgi:hypothetical protein
MAFRSRRDRPPGSVDPGDPRRPTAPSAGPPAPRTLSGRPAPEVHVTPCLALAQAVGHGTDGGSRLGPRRPLAGGRSHAVGMVVHDYMALRSLLRPHEDGWGAAVRARELPGPERPRGPLRALQPPVEVVTGLAQTSPDVRLLPGKALQEGAPLFPVLEEFPHPPQKSRGRRSRSGLGSASPLHSRA